MGRSMRRLCRAPPTGCKRLCPYRKAQAAPAWRAGGQLCCQVRLSKGVLSLWIAFATAMTFPALVRARIPLTRSQLAQRRLNERANCQP